MALLNWLRERWPIQPGDLRTLRSRLRPLRWVPLASSLYRDVDFKLASVSERQDALGLQRATPVTARTRTETRVLHLLHFPQTLANGYNVRAQSLLAMLDIQGINYEVLQRPRFGLSTKIGSIAVAGLPVGVPSVPVVHRLSELAYIEHYSRAVVRYAKKHGCSHIHAHSNFVNGLAAVKAAAELEVPVTYELRGLWQFTREVKQPRYANSLHQSYVSEMELLAARMASNVVALNEPLKRWLLAGGVPRDSIEIITNVSSVVTELESSERKNGLALGYFGTLTSYERVEEIIAAFCNVRDKLPACRLVIAGAGPELESIQRIAHGCSGVEVLGHIDGAELESAFSEVDVIINARLKSRVTEMVTPLKLIDAFVAGKAIIAPDLASFREVLKHGDTGLLYEPDSARVGIEQSLLNLLTNNDLLAKLRRNAELAGRNLTKSLVSAKLPALYGLEPLPANQLVEASRSARESGVE